MNKRMIKQAQEIQKQMVEMQEELENSTVEATAGGGAVTVVVSGKIKIKSLTIDPTAIDPEDAEFLQDMVQTAVNDALEKAQNIASSKMGALTGGLKIPGLM